MSKIIAGTGLNHACSWCLTSLHLLRTGNSFWNMSRFQEPTCKPAQEGLLLPEPNRVMLVENISPTNLPKCLKSLLLGNSLPWSLGKLLWKSELVFWELTHSYLLWTKQQNFMLCAQSLQSCPTLCDPMNCSLPGSSVHSILQARLLEWVAMPSSRGIFLTQGSNPHLLCLLHWQADSLPLVPPGKPKFHIFTQDFGAHIDQENPKGFAQGFCSAENRTLKNSSEREFAHANKQLVTIANGCSFPLAAILTETYWAICKRKWQPTSVFLPGKPHGQRSLACYSPWGRKESDTTERLQLHLLSYLWSSWNQAYGRLLRINFWKEFSLLCSYLHPSWKLISQRCSFRNHNHPRLLTLWDQH